VVCVTLPRFKALPAQQDDAAQARGSEAPKLSGRQLSGRWPLRGLGHAGLYDRTNVRVLPHGGRVRSNDQRIAIVAPIANQPTTAINAASRTYMNDSIIVRPFRSYGAGGRDVQSIPRPSFPLDRRGWRERTGYSASFFARRATK
jgi:hypothetical protein